MRSSYDSVERRVQLVAVPIVEDREPLSPATFEPAQQPRGPLELLRLHRTDARIVERPPGEDEAAGSDVVREERGPEGEWDVDVDDVIETAEQKGGEVTVFSGEFDPGQQLRNLGGIAALLRYRID